MGNKNNGHVQFNNGKESMQTWTGTEQDGKESLLRIIWSEVI